MTFSRVFMSLIFLSLFLFQTCYSPSLYLSLSVSASLCSTVILQGLCLWANLKCFLGMENISAPRSSSSQSSCIEPLLLTAEQPPQLNLLLCAAGLGASSGVLLCTMPDSLELPMYLVVNYPHRQPHFFTSQLQLERNRI